MGPENSGGPFMVYFDGQPVEIAHPLPEITAEYSAGGAAQAMESMAAAMAGASIAMKVEADGLREFFHAVELSTAIWVARIFEPEMVHRYIHTKKKRTRKKYEKRILAWFREVLG